VNFATRVYSKITPYGLRTGVGAHGVPVTRPAHRYADLTRIPTGSSVHTTGYVYTLVAK